MADNQTDPNLFLYSTKPFVEQVLLFFQIIDHVIKVYFKYYVFQLMLLLLIMVCHMVMAVTVKHIVSACTIYFILFIVDVLAS